MQFEKVWEAFLESNVRENEELKIDKLSHETRLVESKRIDKEIEIPKNKRDWKSTAFPYATTVRSTLKEKKRLQEMANKSGYSISRLLVKATLNFGIKPMSDTLKITEELGKLRREVRKIGNNLNQIAHCLNASYFGSGEPPEMNEIMNAIADNERMSNLLKSKLKL